MEQRIAPTSPKNNLQLPESKQTYAKQQNICLLTFVGVLIISVIGGAAGMLLVLTQSSNMGLDIFKDALYVQQLVSRTGYKAYQDQQQQLQKQTDTVTQQQIFLYTKQKTTDAVASVLPTSSWKGMCALLTTDGLCITPASVVRGAQPEDLEAINRDGSSIAVSGITIDDVSGLAYVQLEKGSGITIDIADVSDPFPLDAIQVVISDPNASSPIFSNATLQRYPYGEQAGASGYVVSSDAMYSTIFLRGAGVIPRGSLILRPDGVVLGLYDGDAISPKVLWLPERKSHVMAYLSTKVMSYAGFGVHGIDLSFAPKDASVKETHGFLLSPTPDAKQPAVTPKSPADKAGLQKGDIIIKFDKSDLSATHSLADALRDAAPSATIIPITIVRNGKQQDLTVTLSAL